MRDAKERLWETIDLGWFRRERPLARLRRTGSAVAILAALGWCASGLLGRGGEAIFAGPLTPAHAALALECRACHAGAWEGARRAVGGDDRPRNPACLACHRGDLEEDPATRTARHSRGGGAEEAALACSRCHEEHRGRAGLAASDETCIACHAALARRGGEPGGLAVASLRTNRLAAGAGGHPPFAVPRDPGRLRFDHRLHVDPRAAAERKGEPALECAACHEPEPGPSPAGASLRPVRYALHCARCHPLEAGGAWPETRTREGAVPAGAVPHETPEAVRLFLLARAAESRGTAGAGATGAGAAGADSSREDPARAALAAAERRLYEPGAGVCARCHALEPGPEDLPSIAPSALPERWFRAAAFDHRAHRLDPSRGAPLACTRCHEAALTSPRAADVLLPSIERCRECHVDRAVAAAAPGGVPTGCATCHRFHRPAPRPSAR
jgi:hypothetical protein